MVTVIASAVFAAISGSAPATTAAMGSIMIPAMTRAGYDKAFATAVAVSSGVLGPLIPPSIAFVIWGVIAEQSIGRLFLSGIVPGLAIAAGLLVVCYVHARRHKVPLEARATWRETADGVPGREVGADVAGSSCWAASMAGSSRRPRRQG